MIEIIGVSFGDDPRIYTFESDKSNLAVGDNVVVETERAVLLGRVTYPPKKIDDSDLKTKLTKIRRKATEEDLKVDEENREKEKEAHDVCLEKIAYRNLPMKLVNVEFFFDRSKIIFYFVADGRIDFRELVKDLAHEFQTRIEMRQIGVRDEAKFFGGLGTCGREFCCKKILSNFEPVSVRMAKEQNLALNPMKISGACGRLMCCLAYEYDTYMQLKGEMPNCGRNVETKRGAGRVIRQDPVNQRVTVKLDDGGEEEFDRSEIKIQEKKPVKQKQEPENK